MSKYKFFNTRWIISFEPRVLKKKFCVKCKDKLERKLKIVIYEKPNIRVKHDICIVYHCPNCNYYIDYKNQVEIESKIKPNSDVKKLIKKYKVNV